ncbi:KAP family NTPase, partial [Solicola sp. PLA-1-18]|uniref:KAP family NTPase n=1 Tax=Solicola sp. PLA-1-18 TaxID=3380532 RepID=UPI003B7C6599
MTLNWSDDPIAGTSEDSFERSEFAKAAAGRIIDTHSWNTSTVFALTGPWGTGKSSVITMVLEHLHDREPDWRAVMFSPWASADSEALVAEFYTALASALPASGSTEARRALERCLTVASPGLKAIPLFGAAAAGYADLARDRLKNPKPWHQAFKEASATLEDVGVPILIVIDDLDRLQRDELMALLRVVRLLGRFPGVQFLLAYDEQTLAATLSGGLRPSPDSHQDARRFIEKIVQYPLSVPPLSDTQVLERLNDGLNEIVHLTARDPAPLTAHRFVSIMRTAVRGGLRTPRAIDRYLAQVGHAFSMIGPDEIDDADLAMLTFLKVHLPGLYETLPLWKSQLCRAGRRTRFMSPQTGMVSDEPVDYGPLFESVPQGHLLEQARLVMSKLFPVITQTTEGTVSRHERSIARSDYFDRYFTLSVSRHDVRDAAVREALYAAAHPVADDGGALHGLLQNSPDSSASRLALVLDKARTATDNDATGSLVTPSLISSVAGALNQIDDTQPALLSNRESAVRWLATMIRDRAEDWDAEVLVDALSGGPALLRVLDAL